MNDAPGFVANRILLPMINEAIFSLQDGVADRDTIDTVMRLGASHPIGPLALADLIGLDVCLAIMDSLHHEFGDDKYRPAPCCAVWSRRARSVARPEKASIRIDHPEQKR